jgi:type IV secretory pathway VirB2 component (pilin)
LGLSILTLIVMLLPSIFERRFNLEIPSEFEIALILFIYAAMFLGEQRQFYDKFWWWDKMLHSISGLILGNIGFLIVNYLNRSSKMNIKLSPVFVAIFPFCFAVTMGPYGKSMSIPWTNYLGSLCKEAVWMIP